MTTHLKDRIHTFSFWERRRTSPLRHNQLESKENMASSIPPTFSLVSKRTYWHLRRRISHTYAISNLGMTYSEVEVWDLSLLWGKGQLRTDGFPWILKGKRWSFVTTAGFEAYVVGAGKAGHRFSHHSVTFASRGRWYQIGTVAENPTITSDGEKRGYAFGPTHLVEQSSGRHLIKFACRGTLRDSNHDRQLLDRLA